MTQATHPSAYTIGSVTSRDGTLIGYRQFGHGPGIIAVHGGMQAAQNFMRLAGALADAFTVYVPDRRGRGLSGPPGAHYSLQTECEDLDALLRTTGVHNVFGLSSGALIVLHAALTLPATDKVALYEPPLSIDHSTPTQWVTRYDREVAQGKLGSAMLTALRGTQMAPPILRFVPRFLLAWLLDRAARQGSEDVDTDRDGSSRRPITAGRVMLRLLLWPLRKAGSKHEPPHTRDTPGGDVPLRTLVPTMHYDAQLVIESEGTLERFRGVQAEVLLLGGSRSPRYLKTALVALGAVLPNVRRVEFQGVGHLAPDNTGRPEQVAEELRRFFT